MKQSARLFIGVLVAAFMLASMTPAMAQQKQLLSYKVGTENFKYTQQHTIDVGDVPGHQVRIYEIHRTFPMGGPKFNGLRLVEQWSRAFSDYTDLNGPSTVYNVYVLENGDKVFARGNLIAQTIANADGSKKTTATSVAHFSGGTGKFGGIQGSIKAVTISNIKAGLNETQVDVEYWIEK